MAGLALLATNPDWTPLAMILGVLVLISTVILMLITGYKWPGFVGILVGIGVLALPGMAFQAEMMGARGQHTDVRVVSVQTSHGKHGLVYTCKIQRVDGKPLPHAELGSDSCYGPSQVGATEEVLVDPAGWFAPEPGDMDNQGAGIGLAAAAALLALYELLIWLTYRGGVRKAKAGSADKATKRPGRPGSGASHR